MTDTTTAGSILTRSLNTKSFLGIAGFALLLGATVWTRWLSIRGSIPAEAESAVLSALVTTLFIAVVGASLLAITLVRDTAGALGFLNEKAARIEEGEFDVNLDAPRYDEVGRLFAAVRSMRDAIAARIEELETAQREAEVAQREAER